MWHQISWLKLCEGLHTEFHQYLINGLTMYRTYFIMTFSLALCLSIKIAAKSHAKFTQTEFHQPMINDL